ncbi:MAG: hypothetical protein WC498_01225 [Candidatus Saccharimonadales bacterium]
MSRYFENRISQGFEWPFSEDGDSVSAQLEEVGSEDVLDPGNANEFGDPLDEGEQTI